MSNTLVFNTFNFAQSFLGAMFNELQLEIEKGNNVYYVTCFRSFERCGFNLHGLSYACEICEYRYNKTRPLIEGPFHELKLSQLVNDEDKAKAAAFMNTVEKIHSELYYENFDVGDSVLSSYISKTRDKEVENKAHVDEIRRLAQHAVATYLALKRAVVEMKIDNVVLFNGRWDYYRALLRVCDLYQLPCRVVENLRPGGYLRLYQNTLPHNIRASQNLVEQTWEKAGEDREQVGSEFFERKRKGETVVDRSYIKNQQKSLLPEGVDTSKRLFVLFNSSDDEQAAVGKEFRNPFFKDQVEGIRYVSKLVAEEFPDSQLIIRMHPNLTGLNFSYLQGVYDLEGKYPNVILVRPESQVDTYNLMEMAEKVITFGSSIGVESNYWRKPVLLLSKAFYFHGEVATIPGSKEHIKELLDKPLDLHPKVNSLKWGYYLMRGGVKAKYYTGFFRGNNTFKGKNIDKIPFIRRSIYKALKVAKVKNRATRYPKVG